jgi:hypothetical protein
MKRVSVVVSDKAYKNFIDYKNNFKIRTNDETFERILTDLRRNSTSLVGDHYAAELSQIIRSSKK